MDVNYDFDRLSFFSVDGLTAELQTWVNEVGGVKTFVADPSMARVPERKNATESEARDDQYRKSELMPFPCLLYTSDAADE